VTACIRTTRTAAPCRARHYDRVRTRQASSERANAVTPGLTGQAPIKASILANSDQVRQALRRHPERSLAVIIDDTLYQDVVLSRLCGLRPEDYQRVVIRDKYRHDQHKRLLPGRNVTLGGRIRAREHFPQRRYLRGTRSPGSKVLGNLTHSHRPSAEISENPPVLRR